MSTTAAPAFDVARFGELRAARGIGWGAPLTYAAETGSTNDDALAAARAGAASGSVFLADHQTHGRGRRGKTWVAAPGQHLLFSILVRDTPPRADSATGSGYATRDAAAGATAAGADYPTRDAATSATATGATGAVATGAAATGAGYPTRDAATSAAAGATATGATGAAAAGVGVGALTLAVGLGVREALAARVGASLVGASLEAPQRSPLRLKWPNDVLAGTRKLAGILCEGQFVGSRLEAVVIGIGINVLRSSYPPELDGQVACLEALATSGVALEREPLLVEVLAAVEARVRTYQHAGFGALLDEFTRHDALASERVEISGASPLVGTARGVDAAGRLLVESDGLIVPVISGTVRVVAP